MRSSVRGASTTAVTCAAETRCWTTRCTWRGESGYADLIAWARPGGAVDRCAPRVAPRGDDPSLQPDRQSLIDIREWCAAVSRVAGGLGRLEIRKPRGMRGFPSDEAGIVGVAKPVHDADWSSP
jgi:hypothetical protein